MNLIDAVKSNKPFKRPVHTEYYYSDTTMHYHVLKREDILADDWIVKENPITITESEFDAAFKRAQQRIYLNDDRLFVLKDELGFK